MNLMVIYNIVVPFVLSGVIVFASIYTADKNNYADATIFFIIACMLFLVGLFSLIQV